MGDRQVKAAVIGVGLLGEQHAGQYAQERQVGARAGSRCQSGSCQGGRRSSSGFPGQPIWPMSRHRTRKSSASLLQIIFIMRRRCGCWKPGSTCWSKNRWRPGRAKRSRSSSSPERTIAKSRSISEIVGWEVSSRFASRFRKARSAIRSMPTADAATRSGCRRRCSPGQGDPDRNGFSSRTRWI